LVDVSDIAKQLGDKYGGWIPLGEQVGMAEGAWKGVPEFFIDFPACIAKTCSTTSA